MQGIIDVASFNIDYRYLNSRYAVTFGGIDTERSPGLDNFTFTDLYDNTSWSLGISSMKYGDREFGGQAVKGILDTQDDLIRLPPEDFKRWGNQTTFGKPCSWQISYYRCSCSAHANTDGTFDPLYISFGDYQYELSPEYYVAVGRYGNGYACNFRVDKSEDPTNSTVTLGLAFLKNFNVYYDLENQQVGIYGENTVYTGPPRNSHTSGGQGGDTDTGSDSDGTHDGGDTELQKGGIFAGSITELGLVTTILIFSLILNIILLCCCC